MIPQRKKPRPLSVYNRQVLRFIDEYEAIIGHPAEDLMAAAQWAYENGKWEARPRNPVKELARDMARASRQDYITDEQGEPVRRRHSYPVMKGDVQLVFWFKMENGTPEKMKLSLQGRRNGALADVLQADRDRRYFNAHYNPGDPIQMSWNFDLDIEEREYPDEYPEGPEEDQG